MNVDSSDTASAFCVQSAVHNKLHVHHSYIDFALILKSHYPQWHVCGQPRP